jgi:hypothetical protein
MSEGLSLEREAEIKIERIRTLISWRTEGGAFEDDEESKLFEWFLAERERLIAERDEAQRQLQRMKNALWEQ